ncbi:MAG TPA: SOS response-associated peptidase family protein [Novosphingobium sp.]|nr:SOS response-associated peptidase family protein [Novosphingobium sp.]
MCNLYRMTRTVDEVAGLFAAVAELGGNTAAEVYPGYPGWVVAERRLRAMTWGFPLALTGKQGQKLKSKPINNARADKLGSAFWRDSFVKRRCLIPVSAWAEAEGEKGRMTRTWYSLDGEDPAAVAGLWRPTAEWGAAYAMVMVDGCAQMADVHDRMPVVLRRDDWPRWTDGTPEDAAALCRTCDLPLGVERTAERWAGGAAIERPAGLL